MLAWSAVASCEMMCGMRIVTTRYQEAPAVGAWLRFQQIIAATGDHLPYSAPRVGNVAAVSGNNVNMKVRYRLTRRLANVHADIEAVRCITLENCSACGVDRIGQSLSLRGGRVEPARDVAGV
jgi:hypothetical protein